VLGFLTSLYHQGLGHSAINTARSAISAVTQHTGDTPLGQHRLVARLMKGVFNSRPVVKTHTHTWDVQRVLNHMSTYDIHSRTLLQMSQHLVTLLALLSGKRGQTLHSIKLQHIHNSQERLEIAPPQIVKQSRPGYQDTPICIPAYPQDRNLCAVFAMFKYLRMTYSLRSSDHLLIGAIKPHKYISRSTVSH
jgi:hypothetical protein